MNQPLVTVVVPAFDPLPRIQGAIRSILGQTVSDIEVLVIDDGSQQPIELAVDPRLTIVRHAENRGYGGATETALHVARGQWLCWVDSDDSIAPTYLETMLSAGSERDADIVLGRIGTSGPSGRVGTLAWRPPGPVTSGSAAVSAVLSGQVIAGQHILAKRAALVCPPDTANTYGDLIFLVRNLLYAERVAFVDEPLYDYYIHDGSVTGRLRESVWDLARYPSVLQPALEARLDPADVQLNVSRLRVLAVSQMLHKAARESRPSQLRTEVTRWCRSAITARDLATALSDRQMAVAASLALARVSPSMHRGLYQWYSARKAVSA